MSDNNLIFYMMIFLLFKHHKQKDNNKKHRKLIAYMRQNSSAKYVNLIYFGSKQKQLRNQKHSFFMNKQSSDIYDIR